MEIKRIRREGKKLGPLSLEGVRNALCFELRARGFDFGAWIVNSSRIDLSNIRLDPDIRGYNLSPYTGYRGRILGWRDWVEVNDTVNDILDRLEISASVQSLQGKFRIRDGMKRYTEGHWLRQGGYDNVGSVIAPVLRKDAWLPESERGEFKTTRERTNEFRRRIRK